MKKILIANWKMNMDLCSAESFFADMPMYPSSFIGIAAPYTILSSLKERAASLGIHLGAQNMNENKCGAYTGEVSVTHLLEVGVEFVILGHSERRAYFYETDDRIERKIETAVVEGMSFILCVGETKEQKNSGQGDDIVLSQIRSALSSLTEANLKNSMIAYEPVWAIGTGNAATDLEIEQKHNLIREELVELFGAAGNQVPILYGGSVSLENLDRILLIENVDGTLVGGASLNSQTFNSMIQITGEHT